MQAGQLYAALKKFMMIDDREEFDEFLKTLRDTKAAIAGSCVLHVTRKVPADDIDIWIPTAGIDDLESKYKMFKRVLYKSSGYSMIHPIALKSAYKRLQKYVYKAYQLIADYGGLPSVQLLFLHPGREVMDVVNSFDLDVVAHSMLVVKDNPMTIALEEDPSYPLISTRDIQSTKLTETAIKDQTSIEWLRTISRIFKYYQKGIVLQKDQWDIIVENIKSKRIAEAKEFIENVELMDPSDHSKQEYMYHNVKDFLKNKVIKSYEINMQYFAYRLLSRRNKQCQPLFNTFPMFVFAHTQPQSNIYNLDNLKLTCEFIKADNSDLPKTVYDFIEAEEFDYEKYVAKKKREYTYNGDTSRYLIFANPSTEKSAGYDIEVLSEMKHDPSRIFYACSDNSERPRANKSLKYFKLSLDSGQFVIPMYELNFAMCTNCMYTVWKLVETDRTLNRTISKTAANRRNPNWVSANHCQAGTQEKVYSLRPLMKSQYKSRR